MPTAQLENSLLKLAKQAFETASTLALSQRIEVYVQGGRPRISDILDPADEILYGPDSMLCYQVYGYDDLEDEIKAWIDQARLPVEEDHPVEPTELEKAILDVTAKIARTKGVTPESVSSYEVFANLSVDLLEQIEHAILEYWWHGADGENGRRLALQEIRAAFALR